MSRDTEAALLSSPKVTFPKVKNYKVFEKNMCSNIEIMFCCMISNSSTGKHLPKLF